MFSKAGARLKRRNNGFPAGFDKGQKEFLLVLEIAVDCPAAHSGARSDLFERRPVVTLFTDNCRGRLNEFRFRTEALAPPSTNEYCRIRLLQASSIIYDLVFYTAMYYCNPAMSHWQRNLPPASLFGAFLPVAGYVYQRIGERRDRKRNPAPGRMVSVGDHKLHLFCKGSAAPTVAIEQGAGEPARLWWPVQDQVAEFASVCTYDRAGYCSSDSAPAGRTIVERAEELLALLTNAGIPGPYILVAHSYGGLIVRCFARKYPDQTAGLVFVDTPDEAVIFRQEVLNFYSRVRLMSKGVEFAARFGLVCLLGTCFPAIRAAFPFSRGGRICGRC